MLTAILLTAVAQRLFAPTVVPVEDPSERADLGILEQADDPPGEPDEPGHGVA